MTLRPLLVALACFAVLPSAALAAHHHPRRRAVLTFPRWKPVPARKIHPVQVAPPAPSSPPATQPTVTPSPVSGQTVFTVNDTIGLDPAQLTQIEQAITVQVANDVNPYWHTGPISFGPGGIPVTIEPDDQADTDCRGEVSGCHSYTLSGDSATPDIFVGWDASAGRPYEYLSYEMSHEILETLVDPLVNGEEICDPVAWDTYQVDGEWVADFVEPDGSGYDSSRASAENR